MRDYGMIWMYVGMAIQAFITSFLTFNGLIDPTGGQQILAGVFFVIIAVLIFNYRRIK